MKLSKETIDRIVEKSGDQADMTIALYEHVFPGWDQIKSIDGWPYVSMKTAQYIAQQISEKGWPMLGVWFNKGFGSRREYTVDWMVCCEDVRVDMEGE